MSKQITLELSDEALAAVNVSPDQLSREVTEAAVLRWFEDGRLSQGQAAAALGLSRGQFFDLLHEHRVSPIQITPAELEEEFRRG
jgi:hypothetical protein